MTVESPGDSAFPIVDAGHHLLDRPSDTRYLLQEFLSDIGSEPGLRATVCVECHNMYRPDGPEALRPLGHTEFVNGMAAMSASGQYGPIRIAAAIIGQVDLTTAEAADDILQAHMACSSRFRGIRVQAQWDEHGVTVGPHRPPRDLLHDPAFRIGLSRLQARNLVCELMIFHPQLRDVAQLAHQFPHTTFVVNHMGAPLGVGHYSGRRDTVFSQWRQDLALVANNPNVSIKIGGQGSVLSGMVYPRQPGDRFSDALAAVWRPYVETCIELFTPDRCMYESNFPSDRRTYPYGDGLNALKTLTACLSDNERRSIFAATAKRIYRLEQVLI